MQMNGQHTDAVNPAHYKSRDVECIELVEMLPFCEGNAVKYLWRMGLKGPALEDLKKALWYVERAITSGAALKTYRPRPFLWTLDRALKEFSDDMTRHAIKAIATRHLNTARDLLQTMIADASGVQNATPNSEACPSHRAA